MARDDRQTDDPLPKRRGKAATITLEASEVAPPEAESAVAATSETPAGEPVQAATETAAASAEPSATEAPPAAEAAPEPVTLVEPPAPEPDGTFREPPPRAPDAAPQTGTFVPPPAAPVPSAGFGRLVAAGLIGALLTGGLGVAAQLGGYLPGAGRDQAASLERRLADLDRAVKEAAARPAPTPAPAVDIAPLTRRLEGLDAARTAIETRIAALERRPAATATGDAPAPAAPASVDLDPVKAEIQALKTAVEAIASAQRSAATAAANAPPPPPATPTVDMAAIEARIRTAAAAQTERLTGVEQRVQGLGREVQAAVEAARAAGEKAAGLDAARSQATGLGQRAALVVGIGSLRAAIDRGAPYAAELRTALALGLPAPAAQGLESTAERGLPTPAVLAQRFAVLAPSLIRAAPAAAPSGGVIDRLLASAQALVRVRPIGEAAGDDVPTVVARIEAKLRRGDLTGALADFDRLPEPVRAIGASWAAEARARQGADETLRRIGAEATAALTRG